MYTLVQHSAAVVNRDPQFARGIELHHLSAAKDIKAVRAAGGILVESYALAADLEDTLNYPDPSYTGLTPKVCGTFARVSNLVSPVYVPTAEETTTIATRIALQREGLSSHDAKLTAEAVASPAR